MDEEAGPAITLRFTMPEAIEWAELDPDGQSVIVVTAIRVAKLPILECLR